MWSILIEKKIHIHYDDLYEIFMVHPSLVIDYTLSLFDLYAWE